LPCNGILPSAKCTLCPSLAFSYICSVTARHSSSGRQPNFAAWDKDGNYRTFAPRLYHLYLTGRPSRWASAHVSISLYSGSASLWQALYRHLSRGILLQNLKLRCIPFSRAGRRDVYELTERLQGIIRSPSSRAT